MLRIQNYSDKSFVLLGDTFPIKDEIKKIGGSFNKGLDINGTKHVGWIFTTDKKSDVEALISNPNIKSKVNENAKPTSYQTNNTKSSINIDPKITHEMFANLLNKYEILEARLQFVEEHLKLTKQPITTTKSKTVQKKKEVVSSSDEEDEEEEYVPSGRLLI